MTLAGAASAFGQDASQEDVTVLDTVTVTAPPLNKAFEVNVGAFGAKDTMEVPLAIQSYGAELISETSRARCAMCWRSIPRF